MGNQNNNWKINYCLIWRVIIILNGAYEKLGTFDFFALNYGFF